MGRAPLSAPVQERKQPLLRAPPFPGMRPRTPLACAKEQHAKVDAQALLTALREARVGGTFWGKPWLDGPDDTIARASASDPLALAAIPAGGDAARFIGPRDGADPVDPWSALETSQRLVAHGDDEWIAIAVALGLEVTVLSEGPFGAPDDGHNTLVRRASIALHEAMPDPFGEGWLDPAHAIAILGEWRRVLAANRGARGERIVAACGMSWWKRNEIRRFLWSPGSPLALHRSGDRALRAAARAGGALAVWPSRISADLEEKAKRQGVKLVRVEDGFVRSVGLGSNLVPPLSVIVDRQGIHYDPSQPSDLETMLATAEFSPATLERAARLRAAIVEARISKYAAGAETGRSQAEPSVTRGGRRIVLVPGQVEDDMSVLAGSGGLTSNLELLRRTRALEPDAEIWWRPHPDVDAGHRKGAVVDTDALAHADRIVREGSMSDLLDRIDALHTITSLSGFEALMRGRCVTCHGVPFYAGWGLTRDLGDAPARRTRSLSLDELVAGVLLLYPRYLDPVTGLPCPPETLIQRLAKGEAVNRLSWVEPLRRIQGRIARIMRGRCAR